MPRVNPLPISDMSQNPKEQVNAIYRMLSLDYNPAPLYVYKPRNDGSGVALKLNLRLQPEFASEEGNEFVKDVDGGLFMEIVSQAGKTEDGKYATFAWSDESKKVTAKLGLNDQLAFLTAYREVRFAGGEVPPSLRPKQENEHTAWTVSRFHKFGKGSTAINYRFGTPNSNIGISKSATQRKQIALSEVEELQVMKYLELSLEAYLKLGIR